MTSNDPPSPPEPSEETEMEAAPGTEASLSTSDFILLDSTEFREFFNIGPRTEFRWRRSGVLPYIKIMGRFYYRLSDIRDLLDQNLVDPDNEKND